MIKSRLALALHVAGYPFAVVAIFRLRSTFRDRNLKWFAVHEGGTAAIVAAWAIRGNRPAVVINATWLAGVTAAWFVAPWRAKRATVDQATPATTGKRALPGEPVKRALPGEPVTSIDYGTDHPATAFTHTTDRRENGAPPQPRV